MINPCHVPDVDLEEMLARFILFSKHIRGNNTIKPDAFMPHPHRELSVTRHLDATEEEIWEAGSAVAKPRKKTLHGRGDVTGIAFVKQGLVLKADPIIDDPRLPNNPNHANITGWPKDDKGQQKQLALVVAAQARLVRPPSQR
jgi:hypothetical protein